MTRSVTLAGADLFRLAAQYLGNAARWEEIAALNGLLDPVVTGVVTLKIPEAGSGGGE
jgi:hypothetical protein